VRETLRVQQSLGPAARSRALRNPNGVTFLKTTLCDKAGETSVLPVVPLKLGDEDFRIDGALKRRPYVE
jgi:hypothetical protein